MTESEGSDELIARQIEYYRARAPEYDEWPTRSGRYDRGPEHRARWDGEIAEVRDALTAASLTGRVLELACGTGWWTEQLVGGAESIDAVDSSAEVLERNRARVESPKVTYIQADLFKWRPTIQYEAVFFSFWLSHVPPDQFEPFWRLVSDCLAPHGRVFLIDSLHNGEYHWTIPPDGVGPKWVATRELSDGRQFEIVKVFHEPDGLRAALEPLGWDVTVHQTDSFFIWGEASRRSAP